MASKDLIDTLIAEAGGEGDAGLVAAAWAIQQRAAARGQTVDQVIRSGFDGYSNPGSGAIKAQQDPALRARVERIVNGVANGTIPNPVPGADHFLSGNVMPSWAKSMQPVATIGGHRFYASGNVPNSALGRYVPPMDVPNTVGTQLSVTPPRIAPTPASVEDRVTARNTAPAPVSPLQAALNQYAIREGNRVTPAPVEDRVTARNSAIARSDAINDAARRASLTSTQSYVGQDRSPTRSMFGNDPMTPSNGPVVATIPSATRQPTRVSTAPISYAGQERGIPTVPSRAPGTGLTPSPSAAQNIASARSEQAIQRSPRALPNQAQLAASTGFRVPQASQFQPGLPVPDRLTPNATLPVDPRSIPQVATPSRLPAIAPPRVPITVPQAIASPARIAPTPASVAQMNIARNGSWAGNVFTPPQRPISSAFLAQQVPQASAPIQQPLRIVVQGANAIPYPQPKPQSINTAQMLQNGRDAVSQSGDNSVGNQRDAAEARSSGAGGRIRRY